MKFIVRLSKPRNPLVAAACRRLAGAHRRSPSARRHQDRMALRQDLQHERPSP